MANASGVALSEFLRQNEKALRRLEQTLMARPESWPPSHEDQQLLDHLDSLCQQKDCLLSRLHWLTDLSEAKAQAEAQHKPILALYLLGRLDEPLSCANSRFFRVALYANHEISRYLQDNYILFWKTVRPAPRITIDFGDGRIMETTITGNSLHYVLDAKGSPVDALPGLVAPTDFLDWLKRSRQLEPGTENALRAYHLRRLTALRDEWKKDHLAAKLGKPKWALPLEPARPKAERPSAGDAGALAISKAIPQMVMVKALQPAEEKTQEEIARIRADETWKKLAALRLEGVQLDQHSLSLLRSQHPNTVSPAEPKAINAIINRFRRSIAEDTVWNEYAFHARIHSWFATGPLPRSLDELNERIYSELFLTPSDDPWLGLLRTDAFTGIPYSGIRRSEGKGQ